MRYLDAATKSLEVVLAGAVATSQLPWTVDYVDTAAAAVIANDVGLTNSATPVTVVAAPATGLRIIKSFSMPNSDTAPVTATVQENVSGTRKAILTFTLAVGDVLHLDAEGWRVLTSSGAVKMAIASFPLAVSSGGTGIATLTNHGVLLGQGTSAVAAVVGTNNTLLHGVTGADPAFSAVVEADLSLTDITTNDATTARHGFVPKLANDAAKFLGGTGLFSIPFGKAAALADGATPALDASVGTVFRLAAAGDRTIAVPTNPTDGQKIVIEHFASGGARTLALNSGAGGFRFGTDVTALTQTVSGKTDYIGCIYNGTDSKWDVVAYSKGY
jgi:hypothetical protein